jgi:periplasmic protein TonB
MKNIIAVMLLCIGLSSHVFAQTNYEEILPPAEKKEKTEEYEAPYVSVEQMPVFPGGESAMFKYLGDNIVYPKSAKKLGITGTVYVYFIIDRNGNVRDAEVKRGVKNGEDLNEEALRVVKGMPQWEPGYQNGKAASVQFTLPITFKLKEDSSDNKNK